MKKCEHRNATTLWQTITTKWQCLDCGEKYTIKHSDKKERTKKERQWICDLCRYFYPDEGTGNGCLKTLHSRNPFKKTIWKTDRWHDVVKKNKQCEYFKKNEKLK